MSILRKYSYIWVTLVLFAGSLLGHWTFGWLAYGAAIAGEASLVISVEDITGKYRAEESYTDPETGQTVTRSPDRVSQRSRDIRRAASELRIGYATADWLSSPTL